MLFRTVLWLASLAFMHTTSPAMEAKVVNDTLILSGPVVQGDIQRFNEALAANPGIGTVVLRNSLGGHVESGYRIGELIRKHGLSTVVSGHCVSSCSRMFLGGKERRFSNDYSLERTFVGFHGHYHANGQLNRALVERLGLLKWIIKYSDGKADRDLVQRWINIELNTGMVAFMHPQTRIFFRDEKTFFCVGREQLRPLGCSTLAVTALDMGVVTDLALSRSPDQ